MAICVKRPVLLVNLMTAEMAYVFFIFHALIIYSHGTERSWKSVLKKTAPFFLLSFFFVSVSVLFKIFFIQGYEGNKISPDIWLFFVSLLK